MSYPHNQSSYHHRQSSYYNSNNSKYPRSSHHHAPSQQQYHPRLINNIPSNNPNVPQSMPPPPNSIQQIKKSYHFAAKASDLFIKPRSSSYTPPNHARNSRFDSRPTSFGSAPVQMMQSVAVRSPTISFSSQHTPQSFIASNPHNISPPNNNFNHSAPPPMQMPYSHNIASSKHRRTRWNTKPESYKKHRRYSSNNNCYKRRMSENDDSDSENSIDRRLKYKKDPKIETFSYRFKTFSNQRNFAKIELESKKNKIQSNELQKYIYRNRKRKRRRHKLLKRNESDNDASNEEDDAFNADLNNSDYAMYEPPFKKPKFEKNIGKFVQNNHVPKSFVKRIVSFNHNLQIERSKKRKQREEYIETERVQSCHWNVVPSKCWFYRCVHMLEGHVLTMISCPDMAMGVSYPRRTLDEIEKKLARIHPLPSLIYKRLFATLHNLSSLILKFPNCVTWNKEKLQSIFEKAIRKQSQMQNIFNFDDANLGFVKYDFSPFSLPECELNKVSFYRIGDLKDCKEQSIEKEQQQNMATLSMINRQMSLTINENEDVANDLNLYDDISINDKVSKTKCSNASFVSSMPSIATMKNCKLQQNKIKKDQIKKSDDENCSMPMETNLNFEFIRRTKVAFTCNKFIISPKLQQIICKKESKKSVKTKEENVKKTKEEKNEFLGEYTWFVETINSCDDLIDESVKKQKAELKKIFENNGVYGPIKAMGLEPTMNKLPTLTLKNVQCENVRMPSLRYLISNYVDLTNVFYAALLLKYFDICRDDDNDDEKDQKLAKKVSKYLFERPKAFKVAFVGSAFCAKTERECMMLQIYFYKSEQREVCFWFNPKKRISLLRVLVRIKHLHKKQASKTKNIWNMPRCIPQPPPLPPSASKTKKKMNEICVNYNWNGRCDAKDCVKKHECVSCGEGHSARICSKECVDFNWAKCENRRCIKEHECSQCGDRQHAAWKCKYLHKIVAERFYFIYKAKKLKNGYFASQNVKKIKKNKEWIERKTQKYAQTNVGGGGAAAAAIALQSNLNHFKKNLSNLQLQKRNRRYSYTNNRK